MRVHDFYFDEEVSQGTMDDVFGFVAEAISGALTNADLVGIQFGLSVIPSVPAADLNVNVVGPGGGVDKNGEPLYTGTALEAVDCSVDEYGAATAVTVAANDRYVSVFMRHTVVLSVPKIDGNGLTVYTHRDDGYEFVVRQGAMAATGTAAPPALLTDGVLLADVLLSFGTTQITAGLIEVTRREDWLRFNGTTLPAFAHGTSHDAIIAVLTMLDTWAATMPYIPTAMWFNAALPAGALPPVLDVQAALNAIVYDLAFAKLAAAGAGGTGADHIGVHGFDSLNHYVQWGMAVTVSAQVALEAIGTAIDGHIAGGAPAHPASAVTTAAIAGTPESEVGVSNVQTVLANIFGHLNARTERATDEVISGAWRFFEGTVGPSVTAGCDDQNPRFKRKLFAQSIQGGSQSPSTTQARIAAGLYSGGHSWASPLSEMNTINSIGDELIDICVLFDDAGNRRIYVFDDTTHKAYWYDPEDTTITGSWDFTGLFPAATGVWGVASVCTDGTNIFIGVWDTGGLNSHHIAACDRDGVALPGWGGSTVLPDNGLSPLALSQTAKIIVAKISAATGLATRICCANDWNDCGSGLSVTTIDAADGSIIASGDGSASGYGVPADWYPSGGMCSDGVHVYVTACDPSGAPPVMSGSGFFHCNIEDPALFAALTGVPANIAPSRTQSIIWDGALLWVQTLLGIIATYEMASETLTLHNVGAGIGAARNAVLDGLNLWVQVLEAADDNVMLKMIPCSEYQSTTALDMTLAVRFSAGMTLEAEAAAMLDTRMGRVCFDGDSVWVIINEVGGVAGSGMVRRVPRAGIR
jgi:hypothetical protein